MENRMRISFFGYNTFLLESEDKNIVIDPGGLSCHWFRFTSLLPKSYWQKITHIFVTHGDIDHYWHCDRVAESSNAKVICNKTMVKIKGNASFLLGPRSKGLKFNTQVSNVFPLSVGETSQLDGMTVSGLKATHGPLIINIGPFKKAVYPGPEERIGWGAIGYEIKLNGLTIVNLGDTLLHKNEWGSVEPPDVLMVPIGGEEALNTMGVKEAIQVVEELKPRMVIPTHYNLKAFFTNRYCPADDKAFKSRVSELGIQCNILNPGDSVELSSVKNKMNDGDVNITEKAAA